jgi:histidyl-tRNA synthetase
MINQRPRGTQDFYGDQARAFDKVVKTFEGVAKYQRFETIQTPIFEASEVFEKSLGETSDVIGKETFQFTDKGSRQMTLRPELTAGICRAFIQENLRNSWNKNNSETRLYSYGPCFRYERPQAGRYRQFHQLDCEIFHFHEQDSPLYDYDNPLYDKEISLIHMIDEFFEILGLTDRVEFQINTIGDKESRLRWREALINYFTKYREILSEDSQKRLEKNPLRILDSKDSEDMRIAKDAPIIDDFLSEESKKMFNAIELALTVKPVDNYTTNNLCKRTFDDRKPNRKIKFTRNQSLVRGLDYYNDFVFEVVTKDLGANGTLFAGGRYDGLIEQMGGKPTRAVGFAGGIERIMLLMEKNDD